MREDLPTGSVTFLFTDVEGSTGLLHELGAEAYAAALAEHRRVVREACATNGGVEVDTQGDAFFFSFPTAAGAVASAQAMTEALAAGPIHLRIGVHTGTPLVTDEGYVGDDVHFAARIAASGHGGQVVLSQATGALLDSYSLSDLGEHRLKDIEGAVILLQLGDGRFPPLKTISNTNLPRPASSFVGRRTELAEVLSLIEGGSRLLTLTGPGGSGKTRLALEAAATLVPSYKAGVFWVGLASLRDPALVVETIAQTLGAKDGPAEHIAEREMLLLLDNLEQVIEAAPEVAALAAACPNLTLFMTSRELLRVRGEVEYEVPPLASPEAVALFCARSRLEPSEEIAELCARLDSLPLAVELAAARTKALTPAQILERLASRLDLLKGGRDADPRQRTLRATIEWSYELLTSEEQRLFARLSVFAGGCTIEAAEEVSNADLDPLQLLVEKSFLRFSPSETGTRYWMLETIREYGAERLDACGESELLRRRHAEYFTALAAESEAGITGPEQESWWHRLTDEYPNIRAALAWSCSGGDPRLALELTAALRRFWWQRGQFGEGEHWYEAALAIGTEQPGLLRAKARWGLSNMALGRGSLPAAMRLLDESLAVFRADGDKRLQIHALTDLGIAHQSAGNLAASEQFLHEARLLTLSTGEVRMGAVISLNLGNVLLQKGELEAASEMFEEALGVLREAQDDQSAATALSNLAVIDLRRGHTGPGAARMRESLALARTTSDRFGLAHSLIVAAALLMTLDATSARRALAVSAAMCAEMELSLDPVEAGIRDETLAVLRASGDDEAFVTLWQTELERDRDEVFDALLASLTLMSA
jgi:predicted ATPase